MTALAAARILSLSLLTAVLSAAVPPAHAAAGDPGAQTFTFGFVPDPAVTWKKTIFDEQSTDFRGVVEDQHQITESELHQNYVQREGGAWELLQVVRKVDMEVNGARVVNPMVEVMTGHEIRLQLDDQGRAVGHEGFRELMRRYERELDPATYGRVRQQMNAESLGLGEVTKRNRSIGLVAGRTASIGERWGVLDRVPVQGAWTAVTGVVEFESWTEIEGIAGVKIVYRYDESGARYAAAEAELTQVISLRPDDWEVAPNNLGVSGEYTWVIDPTTGQTLYEGFEQVVTVPVGNDLNQRGEMRSMHTWRWSKL